MTYAASPVLNPAREATLSIGGEMRRRLHAVTDNWVLPAPHANPAMLEMFRDRDRQPYRSLVPWAGEFAGKYLTHAAQILRVTGDKRLKEQLDSFVKELASLQASDGYLGPWPADCRLTGHAPNAGDGGGPTWDAWGHYHVLLGLLLWHELKNDRNALACARRIGDLFCRTFLDSGRQLVSTGSEEMNLAPIHALCLLHQRTGEERYLAMAREIERDFEAPSAGDYVRTALAGTPFYETPKPRWESLHAIQGVAELYFITGDERYRRAIEHIWWSIAEHDRHNTGGFSSGERAVGNPYHPGAVETCCTVAWMALSVDVLRMTGNSIVADELELSTLNAGLGAIHPSGRWVTYDTPMDGTRTSAAHSIVFQARPGQPELNCCSVNGPRALGLLGDWALMTDADGLVLNYYGPSKMVARRGANIVTLDQTTRYPATGRIDLAVRSDRPARFTLKLRIPHWSARTRVAVNGESVGRVEPGRYLALDRTWTLDDTVRLQLDVSPHLWVGERECAGRASIYRGPLLLTYDPRFGAIDLPALDPATLRAKEVGSGSWLKPWLLFEVPAAGGRTLRLCDFASAGAAGNPYRTWLPVPTAAPARFSRQSPLRTRRR